MKADQKHGDVTDMTRQSATPNSSPTKLSAAILAKSWNTLAYSKVAMAYIGNSLAAKNSATLHKESSLKCHKAPTVFICMDGLSPWYSF